MDVMRRLLDEHNAKSRSAFLGAVAVVVLLGGCTEATLLPLESGAVVLAFGDSLTFGTGATPETSYPSVLSELVGRKVVRSGIPGETSAEGLARLPTVLAQVRPDLVVLLHGGNDVLRRVPSRETERNVAAMVDLVQDSGADVLLVAAPARSFTLSDLAVYEKVAEAEDVPLVKGLLGDVLRDPGLKSDRVHPNAAGYRVLAEGIASFLSPT